MNQPDARLMNALVLCEVSGMQFTGKIGLSSPILAQRLARTSGQIGHRLMLLRQVHYKCDFYRTFYLPSWSYFIWPTVSSGPESSLLGHISLQNHPDGDTLSLLVQKLSPHMRKCLKKNRLVHSVKPTSLGASLHRVCLMGTLALCRHFVPIDTVQNE